ncbi:MAG: hypothetical protein HKN45_04555 [Flavobacteriales bacterium]|nr:hypothetical protein [Flavobacteriales bacterium]NNK81173.1 hypothetical protein [Flavobacteriales bacterium]
MQISPSFKILILLVGFISLRAESQENCETSSELWRNYKRFIPKDESPVFTIKLNYIIPQRTDGTGNFQEDNPEHMELLEKSLKKINKLWSELKKPKDPDCYPYDDFLDDTHIRFVLNEIIFIQDDFYWNADNGSGCPNDRNWFINPLEEEIRSDPRYDNAINVYLTNLPGPYEEMIINGTSTSEPKGKSPCSELPSHTKLNRSSRINMAGTYNKFWWMKNIVPVTEEYNSKGYTWEESIKYWMSGSFEHTMTHELGHSMGLNHANEFHGRNKCDESIMNQSYQTSHNYLQPTEIGKIHRNLRMTNIRKFLLEDVYSEVPFIVDEDADFEMSYLSYEDIIVKSGKKLVITCELDMPSKGVIIVEPGAEIVIQGARVHHRNAANRIGGIILQKERAPFWVKRSKRKRANLNFENNGSYIGTTQVKKVKRIKE